MIALIFGIFLPLLILLSIVFWSIKNGIGPMPSSRKQIRSIISCIPADLDGPILELGSGWGSLAFSIARQFPERQITGYESSPLPFLISKVFFRLPNLRFYRKDFHDESLAGASVIVCYLYPGGMEKLKPKLEADVRHDTWVITNTFAVPSWQPWEIKEINDLYRSKIYVYKL